jgi:hypothetical protein
MRRQNKVAVDADVVVCVAVGQDIGRVDIVHGGAVVYYFNPLEPLLSFFLLGGKGRDIPGSPKSTTLLIHEAVSASSCPIALCTIWHPCEYPAAMTLVSGHEECAWLMREALYFSQYKRKTFHNK